MNRANAADRDGVRAGGDVGGGHVCLSWRGTEGAQLFHDHRTNITRRPSRAGT